VVGLVLLVLAYDVEARAFGTTTQHRVARWNIITRIELQLFCKVFQLLAAAPPRLAFASTARKKARRLFKKR